MIFTITLLKQILEKCLSEYYGTRSPKRQMTVTEVMTLNIIRILNRTADLKTFHKSACEHYKKYFPNLTSQKTDKKT